MSEFNELKAEYKGLTGKNAPPMSADALRAKIEDLKAAAAAAEGAQPQGDEPQGDEPQGDEPQGDEPQGDEPQGDEPEQSIEEACAELGLVIDAEGQCAVTMLTGLSGPEVNLVRSDPHRCSAAEAVRLVRADFAAPRS
jgi:hypothetical protein